MESHKTYILVGTMTAEQPLATCSKDLLDRKGGKTLPIPVPTTETRMGTRLMFPGTGLRGKLRRATRDVIRQSVSELTGEDKPFSLEEHYFLTLGGIKGEGEQDRASVAIEAAYREKNPLLSLFGAGDAGVLGFVQGRLSVGNAICQSVSEPVVFSGARTDDLYRDKAQVAFLSDDDVAALIRQAKGGKDRSIVSAEIKKAEADLKSARRANKEDDITVLETKIAELKEQLKAGKEASGTSDVSIGMPLAGWQAIPQGAVMDWRLHLVRSNLVELGLFLQALNQLATSPFVGAHYANGCGLISAQWEVFEATLDGKNSLGTVSLTPFEPLDIDGAVLSEAVASWKAFMQNKAWDFGVPVLK